MNEQERQREIAELRARLAALEAEPVKEAPTGDPAQLPPAEEGWHNPAPPWASSSRKKAEAWSAKRVGITAALSLGGLIIFATLVRSPAPAPSPATPASGPAAAATDLAKVRTYSGLGPPLQGAATPDAAASTPASSWVYTNDVDELTDKTEKTACVDSEDSVALQWPYSATGAALCIRRSPRFGTDVYVRLHKDGQFICHTYRCRVRLRFDKGAVRNFGGNGAADGSSDVIFIAAPQTVITALKSADRTLVEAEYYQAGVQTLTFPTAGLKWP